MSCSCTCTTGASWCCHVVAVCLFRILKRDSVEYRKTVWESINELEAAKLKKFAQNLINDLPRQVMWAQCRDVFSSRFTALKTLPLLINLYLILLIRSFLALYENVAWMPK